MQRLEGKKGAMWAGGVRIPSRPVFPVQGRSFNPAHACDLKGCITKIKNKEKLSHLILQLLPPATTGSILSVCIYPYIYAIKATPTETNKIAPTTPTEHFQPSVKI